MKIVFVQNFLSPPKAAEHFSNNPVISYYLGAAALFFHKRIERSRFIMLSGNKIQFFQERLDRLIAR